MYKKDNENCPDALLWNKFRSGEHESLEQIYNLHIQALYRYGLKLSADESFVMDCIHDLFVDLFKNRKTVGTTVNIRFYLIRSLKNKIIRSASTFHKNIFRSIEDHPFFLEPSVEEPSLPEEKEMIRHKRRLLREALDKLPDRQKEAVYLRYINNFNNEEIAQIMGISYQAVRNTLHKAIENLRKSISREDLILFLGIYSFPSE